MLFISVFMLYSSFQAFDLCNQICDKTPPRSLSFDVGESNDSSSSSDNNGEDDRKHGRIVVAKHDRELALESRFSNDYGLRYDGNFKISLKSNAIAAYTSLAAININKNKCGRALKYLKIALSCLGMSGLLAFAESFDGLCSFCYIRKFYSCC